MAQKEKIKNLISAALIVITGSALFIFLMLALDWYIGLPALALVIAGSVFAWKKLSQRVKRIITENIFIIITGASAIIVIAFVLYLLIHIFLLGKSHISWSFFFTEPTEGLTEGGIFPAIVGTALLVIIMSIVGVPIGTITAIYLTEYAKEKSILARVIRFAVNTLAGVPAIVFGLFGLGFFIGTVGKQIDTWNSDSRIEKIQTVLEAAPQQYKVDDKFGVNSVREILAADDADYWAEEIEILKVLPEVYG